MALLSRVKTKESLSSYKRVKIWPLSDLRLVDCHLEGSELDFKFEKQLFKWVTLSTSEKKSFVASLYKVNSCTQYPVYYVMMVINDGNRRCINVVTD